MTKFNKEAQDNFKADFGFDSPHRTKAKCKNPVFTDHYLHRIALMKDYHIGSKGDIDESGLPGWISKFVCTGCGQTFTINKIKRFFHADQRLSTNPSPIRRIKAGRKGTC